ncbi:MAG: hypothetical protein M3161_04595 [Actinomycetota bacterium]|nr:hypothetical protein [Actinomycetota bacterium]
MKRMALIALALLLVAPGAAAETSVQTGATTARATAPLFAAGGSAVTNGFFFPGTAVYDNANYQWIGEPYEIPQGTDIEFTTTDGSLTLGNGHNIQSFKRRKNGRPLFRSGMVYGPDSTIMITSHLKPGKGDGPDGSYLYTCTVHTGMYGMLAVVAQ